MHRIVKTALALSVLACAGGALAQDLQNYPSRPIRMVTTGSAGSSTDITARLYGEYMSQTLKQPIVVENRAGGQGAIALNAVKQSEANGYTIFYNTNGFSAIVPAITAQFGQPLEDLRIVGFSNAYESLLVTGSTTGIRSVRELIEKARAPGSTMSHAVYGGLATSDLAIAALLQLTGGTSLAVNYRGPVQAMTDLIENRIAFGSDTYASAGPQIRAGKGVALAVLGRSRNPQLPEVPTIAEAGVPELLNVNEWQVWSAVFVRKETPEPIIEQLNRTLRAANANPELQKRLRELGVDAFGTAWGPKESQTEWERRYALWKGVVTKLGVKPPAQ
jgi:tripartite-type tricarboxylate transporter receptor subunit TctC